MILPATDKEVRSVVKEKISPLKSESSKIKIKELIFPQDATQESIEQYKIEEIKEEIVSKIN